MVDRLSEVRRLVMRGPEPVFSCGGDTCDVFCEADATQVPEVSLGRPELHVHGVGDIEWPLSGEQIEALAQVCEIAPYGHGTATKHNKKVRNSWQLAPEKFELGDQQQRAKWDLKVQQLAHHACRVLGLAQVRWHF